MKPYVPIFLFVLGLSVSCLDSGSVVYDGSKPIADNAWRAKDKKEFWIQVAAPAQPYRLSLNLRISNEYRYSNLFVLFRLYGPKKEFQSRRLEFKLANAQGDWLGSGSGNVFTYRINVTDTLHFNQAGVYKMEMEQDMRDEPLRGIIDIGLRLQKRH